MNQQQQNAKDSHQHRLQQARELLESSGFVEQPDGSYKKQDDGSNNEIVERGQDR